MSIYTSHLLYRVHSSLNPLATWMTISHHCKRLLLNFVADATKLMPNKTLSVQGRVAARPELNTLPSLFLDTNRPTQLSKPNRSIAGTDYSSITTVTLATSSLQNTVQDRHNDAPHLQQYRSNLLLWLNRFFIDTMLEINYPWSSRCTTHTYKTGWPFRFLWPVWTSSAEKSFHNKLPCC